MNGSAPTSASSTRTTPSSFPSHGGQSYQQSHDAASTAAAALSAQHTPTPNTAATHGRKRKATGAPGSRGVANLTPEQLAKKRANDREAQRAIRERTRNTIESLEARIRELESQQPFQEIQRISVERDGLREENEQLKQRLAAVAGIAGPTGTNAVGGHPGALNELATLSAQQSQLPPRGQQATQQEFSQHSAAGAQPDGQLTYTSPVSSTATVNSVYNSGESTLRKWSPSLDHPPQQHQYTGQTQTNGVASYALPNGISQSNADAMAAPQVNGERLGLNFLLDSSSQSPETARAQPLLPSTARLSEAEKSKASRLPANSGPTCPLDSLLNDFNTARHNLLQRGVPMRDVIGPDYPSFIALYDPNTKQRNSSHAISALLIDILSKFPDICNLPEKVAVLYIMFLVMRWYICPCEACYERLPEWIRPTAEQLNSPHPIWINHLPWPAMRRKLSTTSKVRFEEFFVPYTTTLSLNWPYPSDQVLSRCDEKDSGGVKMGTVFETHLRDLRNWSLGTKFKTTFPELVDGVRIHDVAR